MNPKPTPIELVKKHWFWGALVAFLGTVVACWWMGTTAIAETTKARTSEIDGAFSGVQGELGKPVHPNESFADGITKIGLSQGDRVWKAWNDLYQYQLDKVLKWPAGLPPGVREKLESGAFFKMPATSAESVSIRNIYRNYVLLDEPNRLKARLKILEPEAPPEPPADANAPRGPGANRPGATAPKPGAPRPGVARPGAPNGMNPNGVAPEMMEIKYKGLVKWENFDSIFNNYPWLSGNQIPSPLAIQYCQEDIWAYTGIIDAIAAANEGISDYRKARVKEIFAMEIGQWVTPPSNSILGDMLPAAAGGEGSGAAPGGEAALQGLLGDQLLKVNRYIKSDGTLLGPEEENPDAEFNLIPFRLVVLMDQRQITKLLSVCANSTLPIRVKQVQMFAASATPARGMGGAARPRFGARPSATSQLPLPSTAQLTTPFDVSVELRGQIYIYQRPTRERLPEVMKKVDEAGAEAAANAVPAANAPTDAAAPAPVDSIVAPTVPTDGNPAAPAVPADAATPAPPAPAPAPANETPAAPADGAPAPADAAAPAAETPAAATPTAGTPAAPAPAAPGEPAPAAP